MDEDEAGLRERLRALEQENDRLAAELERHRNAKQGDGFAEQIYRAIGETIPYGIWICDPDGRCVYASQSLLDMLGVTMEQFANFGWGDSLAPEDAGRIPAAWRQHIRRPDGPMWDMEHRFRGRDGQQHSVLGRGVPVRDEDGRVIYWAGINLDIDALKRAQEELNLSHQRFELALRHTGIVVFTQDRELRYTWIYNPGLGVGAGDVIGKTDEELWGPQEAAQLTACKRAVLESGVGQQREFVLTSTDGEPHALDTTMEPLRDASGGIVGLVAASIDVTEVKHRQEEAVMSAVRGELQRQLNGQREHERQALARDVHEGPMQRLAALNLKVDLARKAAQDAVSSVELGEFRQELKESIRELRDVLGERQAARPRTAGLQRWIRIYTSAFQQEHPDLEVSCRAARGRRTASEYADLALFRALAEALRNVEKHAHATQVGVTLSYREQDAVLEVWDNGPGVDGLAERLEAGRELARIRERLAALEGSLEVVSGAGEGTTVVVTVPLAERKGR